VSTDSPPFADLVRDADRSPRATPRGKRAAPGVSDKPAPPEVVGADDTDSEMAPAAPVDLVDPVAREQELTRWESLDELSLRRNVGALVTQLADDGASEAARQDWRDALAARKWLTKSDFAARIREADVQVAVRRTGAAGSSAARRIPGVGRVQVYPLGGQQWQQREHELVHIVNVQEQRGAPILSGQLSVPTVFDLRDVGDNLAPSPLNLDTVYDVEYTAPGGSVTQVPIPLTDLEAQHPEWPVVSGLGSRSIKAHRGRISDGIKAMGEATCRQVAYGATGPLVLPNGHRVFLRQGKPALAVDGVDPGHHCRLPAATAEHPGALVLTMDDPSPADQLAEDAATFARVLDTVPGNPVAALAVLCALAWSPWSVLADAGRVAVVLAGNSGACKTAIAGLTVQAQSSSYVGGKGVEVPAAVKLRGNQSTTFGADVLLHSLRGMLALADDAFAGIQTAKDVQAAWQRVSLMADNMATGTGGLRGNFRNGRGGMAPQRFPRCSLLFTAEELTDEARRHSEVARVAAFPTGPLADVDLAVLSQVQASGRQLSRAHAAFVQRLIGRPASVLAALERSGELVGEWEGHPRSAQTYRRLLGGAVLLDEYFRSAGVGRPEFLEDASSLFREAAADQGRRSGVRGGRQTARDPVRMFGKHLRAVLSTGSRFVAHTERGPDGEARCPRVPHHSPAALGWRQAGDGEPAGPGERKFGGWSPAALGAPLGMARVAAETGRHPWQTVTLVMRSADFPALAEELSARCQAEEGHGLPDQDRLRAALVEAKILKSATGESVELFGRYKRCLVFDLDRLLNGEDDSEDGSGSGEPPGVPGGTGDADGGVEDATGPVPESVDTRELVFSTEAYSGSQEPSASTDGGASDRDGSNPRGLPRCGVCGKPASMSDAAGPWHPACRDWAPEPTAADPPVTSTGTAPLVVDADSRKPAAAPSDSPRQSDSPRRRTGSAERAAPALGVLDVDGLHLLTAAAPVPAELPANVDQAYALAARHGLRQLWLHARVARALELPPELPAGVAKGSASGHPWATSPELTCDPAGLAPWVNVWPAEKERAKTGVAVVFPGWEDRAPWSDAADGATLLAALTSFADALGQDYYYSPTATAGQLIRRTAPAGGLSVVQDWPEPILARHASQGSWSRPLTDEESDSVYVHRYDLNGAQLATFGGVYLGVGDPVHVGPLAIQLGDAGRWADRNTAGYWRLTTDPDSCTVDSRLPDLLSPWRRAAEQGEDAWVDTPTLALLVEMGLSVEVAEGWAWSKSRRLLEPAYRRLRDARATLLSQRDTCPAAQVAYQALGGVYKRQIGAFARTDGPRGDTDLLYRPDFRDSIIGLASANMYRRLRKIAQGSGRFPLATYVDAVFYTSDESDPVAAAPPGLILGSWLGEWKWEASAPLAAVGKYAGERRFQAMFDREVTSRA